MTNKTETINANWQQINNGSQSDQQLTASSNACYAILNERFKPIEGFYIQFEYIVDDSEGAVLYLSEESSALAWNVANAEHGMFILTNSDDVSTVFNGTHTNHPEGEPAYSCLMRMRYDSGNIIYEYATDSTQSTWNTVRTETWNTSATYIHGAIVTNGSKLRNAKVFNPENVPVIITIGESISGGKAQNTDLLASYLQEQPRLKVWDVVNNDGFERLEIGVNNMLDHALLPNGITHGFEPSMIDSVRDNDFCINSVLYWIPCGQGGSYISNWVSGQTYFDKAETRINGALSNLRNEGKQPIVYIIFALGINDAVAGTNADTWKANVITFFSTLRNMVNEGNIPIYALNIPRNNAAFEAIDDKITELDTVDDLCTSIAITGQPMRDTYHYDATGMKSIGKNMLNLITTNFNSL